MSIGSEPIHEWFGLTYANYLVLNRSILQSMPEDWQASFVALLHGLEETCEEHGVKMADDFWVRARDKMANRFVADPVPRYDRGRTRLWENAPEEAA